MSDRTLSIVMGGVIAATVLVIVGMLAVHAYGAATVSAVMGAAVAAGALIRYRRTISGALAARRAAALERRREREELKAAQQRRIVEDAINQQIRKLQAHAAPHLMLGLHPVGFERFVLSYFRLLGYDAQETKITGDGGVDGVLRRDGAVYLLQCKRYAGHSVGEPPIRDLLGAVTKAQAAGGIFVTTSEFTPTAAAFAAGTTIELIDGEALAARIRLLRITDPAERRVVPPVVATSANAGLPPVLQAAPDSVSVVSPAEEWRQSPRAGVGVNS